MIPAEENLLRLAFTEAQHAKEHGNHPFGAVLVNAEREPLLAAENSVLTQKDVTAHAELNLVRAATKNYKPEQLALCTLYTSAEPCAMCAGAIVWGNIRQVVFGLGMESLFTLIGDVENFQSLRLPSRSVFEYASQPIQVTGAVLEEEALIPHKDFW